MARKFVKKRYGRSAVLGTRLGLRPQTVSNVLLGFAALIVLNVLAAGSAFAQLSFSVNSTGDAEDLIRNGVCETAPGNGICTLRAAIMESNFQAGVDGIGFRIPTTDPGYDAQTGSHTITLTNGGLVISSHVIITGPGPSKLTVSGNWLYRVFDIATAGTVNLSGITVAHGRDLEGAGIRNRSGTLNITNCVVTDNRAYSEVAGEGGIPLDAGGNGGGIRNSGTINIRSSTISFNLAMAHPYASRYAAYAETSGRGGGLYNFGTATVVDTDFYHNQAGIRGGGIFNQRSDRVTITNSTFRENGAFVRGGAVDNLFGVLSVSNSTFFANHADGIGLYAGSSFKSARLGSGGAIFTGHDVEASQVTNSTFTANYAAASGGGMYAVGIAPIIESTIIAGNVGGSAGGPDVYGPFSSQGFNLIGKTDGGSGFNAATDKKGTIASPLNPKLDWRGLRSNGGPTPTVALQSGSPAIDKGTSLGLTGILTTDQRGAGFLRKVDKSQTNASAGDGTDIGAYEIQ